MSGRASRLGSGNGARARSGTGLRIAKGSRECRRHAQLCHIYSSITAALASRAPLNNAVYLICLYIISTTPLLRVNSAGWIQRC